MLFSLVTQKLVLSFAEALDLTGFDNKVCQHEQSASHERSHDEITCGDEVLRFSTWTENKK